jgi:hypothetical protein
MYSKLKDAYPQYDAQGTLFTPEDNLDSDDIMSQESRGVKSEELKPTPIEVIKNNPEINKTIQKRKYAKRSFEKRPELASCPSNDLSELLEVQEKMTHEQALKNFINYRYKNRELDQKTVEHLEVCDFCKKVIKDALDQTKDKMVEGFNVNLSSLQKPVVKDTVAIILIGILTIALLDTFIDLYTSL